MSIQGFIKKVCKQTAVYWGNPISDGFGGFVYDSPVEIKCRWDEVSKLVQNNEGQEVVSNATVLVTTTLDINGVLFLGTLDDLDTIIDLPSSQAFPTPDQVENSFAILTRDKTPEFGSNSKFVNIVYLKPNSNSKL